MRCKLWKKCPYYDETSITCTKNAGYDGRSPLFGTDTDGIYCGHLREHLIGEQK